MSKIIDLEKDVNTLCNDYPELVDVLGNLGFKPLANPVLRKTIGSQMTLTKAAQMKNVGMDQIVSVLKDHGFSVINETVSDDQPAAHSHEPGHVFLARLGKTRLRPGGKDATDWLLEQVTINRDSKVLEVACNMGTTLIEVVEKSGCQAVGVDLDQNALDHAAKNVRAHDLDERITLIKGNAFKLPFEDNTFDVVINEAMLTMLLHDCKDQALSEYARVLKPGGKLLTHDVCLRTEDQNKQKELTEGISRAINVKVEPLTVEGWKNKIESHHFHTVYKNGPMTLLDPEGMVHDEGEEGALKIIQNAMKEGNAAFFGRMFNFFNDHKDDLGYIAFASTKE